MENAEKSGVQYLAEGLKHYVGLSKNWDGNLDTAYPLVVALAEDAVEAGTVEDYHAFGWQILQELHELDPALWPGEVAKDPGSPSRSMCFDGIPLFCNMSSPAHQARDRPDLLRRRIQPCHPQGSAAHAGRHGERTHF